MNKLSLTNSIYLLQHAHNPINWYPWDSEALQIAKKENKPIFLSIGYAACHWCHIMEKETFSDPEIAKFMNENFVSIKVDREERPDLDKIYLDAVTAMTGQGGWPLSIFLTPDQLPIYGGTYFPPTPRYNLPSFSQLLISIAKEWKKNAASIVEQGKLIRDHIAISMNENEKAVIPLDEVISSSVKNILDRVDWEYGGFGNQPKFPQPLLLDFLLTQSKNKTALDAVKLTLTEMIQGGIYDLVRGGFHRYSTDNHWSIPHFEKMLYDNALLSKTYLTAGLVLISDLFLEIGKKILDFIVEELLNSDNLFMTSIDADSEFEEGKYYTWEPENLEKLLNSYFLPKDFFNTDFTQKLDDLIVLRLGESNRCSIQILNHPIFADLKKSQILRTRPITDDKVMTDLNAITIQSFILAANIFHDSNYRNIAQNCMKKLLQKNFQENLPKHVSRNDWISQNEYLGDYAQLIISLIYLFFSDFDIHWYYLAENLAKIMIQLFYDEGYFYDTVKKNQLIFRPKTVEDNITPSGTSAAIQALMLINNINFDSDFEKIINDSININLSWITKYPSASGNWLQLINERVNGFEQLIIVFPAHEKISCETENHIKIFNTQPGSILQISENKIKNLPLDLFLNKKVINNQTTYYFCKNHHCLPPTNQFPQIGNSSN